MEKLKWFDNALLVLGFLVLAFSFTMSARGAIIPAATCNTSDVAVAIALASEGDTVTIPGGSCTWTSGVTVSGLGITIQGAGSGRIIAYDNGIETPTIGTGTQTFVIAGYSPGFSSASISNGEALRIFETNNRGNYMQGTVTSLISGTLTMNITSTGGSGSTHRWLISTIPTLTITDNSASAPLFTIAEDTTLHTSISGIQFTTGTGAAPFVQLNYTSGGQAVLFHDLWMQLNTTSEDVINSTTNRGVIWDCSGDGSSGNPAQLVVGSIVRIKGAPASSWTSVSQWGSGNALYVETNDFHAFQSAMDNDDNGRAVWRYNLMDNSQFSTHGADTSNYGERYFEFYENTGVFNAYNDGSTFNLNGWLFLVRGGTFVCFDNTLPALVSGDYGTKSDVAMTVFNLQRNSGPNPCWGAGFSTGGQYYQAPRQVGFGYVTGAGTANYPPDGCTNCTNDSITYVGDSEPAYIWGNSRAPLNVAITDYGLGNPGSCPGSPTPDTSANYIISGRDYFPNTAKPGYTPYVYPNPLTLSVPPSSGGVLLVGNVKLSGNVKLFTAPSIPDINCIFTPSQNCPSFTPSGDPYSTPGKFAGYADPWLRQDPNHTTHFWFGYSWPTVCTGTPPCNSTGTKPINLHLAEDTGSGFNFVTDLYTTAEITNPETGSTKDQTSYEIMDAIPQDVGGGLTDWYGVLLNYLVPPGGVGPVQADTRRLELAGCQDTSGGGAAGPSCLPGATQQYLGGSQTNTTYWPISQNLTTLSGLSACVGWDEPTLWYDSGADNLYLFAGCSNYSGYYQFSTHAPASHLGTWTWAFVAGSQLGTHADANAICSKYFSNCGATNFLNACEIANSHVSGMVWVCDVQHPIDSSHNFTSGVVAIQLATLSPPSFTYVSAGLPQVLAIATCTQCVADGPGAPAYEPTYTGGMPIAALMTNCIAGSAGCSTQGGYFIQVVGTGLRP